MSSNDVTDVLSRPLYMINDEQSTYCALAPNSSEVTEEMNMRIPQPTRAKIISKRKGMRGAAGAICLIFVTIVLILQFAFGIEIMLGKFIPFVALNVVVFIYGALFVYYAF